MSNLNYVCFSCRTVRRAEPGQTPVCPQCGEAMQSVGSRSEPPERSDRKAWAKWLSDQERWLRYYKDRAQVDELRRSRRRQARLEVIDNRDKPGKAARRRYRKASNEMKKR